MSDHIKIAPQPIVPEGGWKIHGCDATGKWFRPRSSGIYPLQPAPEGKIHFYCTVHGCWEWRTPEAEANVHRAYMIAVEKSIKPLTDMARFLGFGKSFREAMEALCACLEACDAHSLMCAGSGVITEGSQLYPETLELFKKYGDPRTTA
jgi:hypothetical protein